MSRAPGHTLKIKCPTWEHVEAFYAKKIKEGNVLSARVPWAARKGDVVVLALELPDELIIAIEAEVAEAAPAADDRKVAVRFVVTGLTEQLRARLARLVAQASPAREVMPARLKPTTLQPPSNEPELPVALPSDAPIDDLVDPPLLPKIAELPPAVRQVATRLLDTLERMRASAAHDVLGVARQATVEEIRAAYATLVMRHHPDRFARHRSAPIAMLAQEVAIQINKSYDTLRDALVAAGQAIVAGPALLPHRGWLAGFDDLGAAPTRRPAATPAAAPLAPAAPAANPRTAPAPAAPRPVAPAAAAPHVAAPAAVPAASPPRASPAAPAPRPASPAPKRAPSEPALVPFDAASLFDGVADDEGGGFDGPPPSTELGQEIGTKAGVASPLATERQLEQARGQLERGEHLAARDRLVQALRANPRDRAVRSLYHVAQAYVLAAEGKTVDATSQLEAALAHDPTSEHARRAIESLKVDQAKKGTTPGGGLLGRLFKR